MARTFEENYLILRNSKTVTSGEDQQGKSKTGAAMCDKIQ